MRTAEARGTPSRHALLHYRVTAVARSEFQLSPIGSGGARPEASPYSRHDESQILTFFARRVPVRQVACPPAFLSFRGRSSSHAR
jgi:hypothetical protein